MTAETRLHSYVLSITVAVIALIAFVLIPALPANTTSGNRLLMVVISALSSIGVYRLLAIAVLALARKWRTLQRHLLSSHYLQGTWAGRVKTKTGVDRYIVEHYDQSLSKLSIVGRSYTPEGALDATWHSLACHIEPAGSDNASGLVHCFFEIKVPWKHHVVEGVAKLIFMAESAGKPPIQITGDAINCDAGIGASEAGEKEEGYRITYEGSIRLSEELLPFEEAKLAALEQITQLK